MTRRGSRVAVAAAVLLALTSCSEVNTGPGEEVEPNVPSTPRPETEQLAAQRAEARADLQDAEARWADVGPADYDWTLQVVRVPPARTYEVRVRDGAAVDVAVVRGPAPGRPPYTSVEDAFALVRDSIEADDDLQQVTYDPRTGLPRQLSIVTDVDDPGTVLQVRVTAFTAR